MAVAFWASNCRFVLGVARVGHHAGVAPFLGGATGTPSCVAFRASCRPAKFARPRLWGADRGRGARAREDYGQMAIGVGVWRTRILSKIWFCSSDALSVRLARVHRTGAAAIPRIKTRGVRSTEATFEGAGQKWIRRLKGRVF